MAEQMGAVCCADVDSTVTHVVALDQGTEKARWAIDNKKFLVHPRWLEAANFRWCRQPEEDFPVHHPKEKGKDNENAVAGHKETSQDKENAAPGQAKDEGKENSVATTTGPTDS
uniref:protein-serine/threonine phosphatase n=1 Tax=Arundo donax TaxID=35708 RepID=A0A0A9E685_ARUDO